jgi:hypothetical protein
MKPLLGELEPQKNPASGAPQGHILPEVFGEKGNIFYLLSLYCV